MGSVILKTVVPIILLIGAGYCSKWFRLFQSGEEKVFSRFIYYFALPALFIANMSEIAFDRETLKFITASLLPQAAALMILVLIYAIFRFNRDILYLLIICTTFGSHSFFGLPFIMFAYGTKEAERLAVLSSSCIAIVCVSVAITVLEAFRLKEPRLLRAVPLVLKRLSHNPLILSILLGLAIAASGVKLPLPLSRPLRMLGGSAAVMAMFVLGMSFYGRAYGNFKLAAGLGLIRMIAMPFLGLLACRLFRLTPMETSVATLMHATPMALATIVLSEQYDFHREIIPTLMLISSLGAAIYLNGWLWILGGP